MTAVPNVEQLLQNSSIKSKDYEKILEVEGHMALYKGLFFKGNDCNTVKLMCHLEKWQNLFKGILQTNEKYSKINSMFKRKVSYVLRRTTLQK